MFQQVSGTINSRAASNNGRLVLSMQFWLYYTPAAIHRSSTAAAAVGFTHSQPSLVISFPVRRKPARKTINANFRYFLSENYCQFHPTYVIYYHYPRLQDNLRGTELVLNK